jgi:hypothetical protein
MFQQHVAKRKSLSYCNRTEPTKQSMAIHFRVLCYRIKIRRMNKKLAWIEATPNDLEFKFVSFYNFINRTTC